jgi:hypothetical protein
MVASPTSTRRPPDQPGRRSIRIYSFDPMLANTLERIGPATATVEIPWEPLDPGPSGLRIQVIDFDGGRRVDGQAQTGFYEPIDLDDARIAAQAGLRPTEGDPRFHQQMVYTVAMRTLEAYDRALGRRIRPVGGRMRLFPHAFRGPNAFYDPDLRAVLFGYFQADRVNPGPNLPGQPIFTCLSHDIISHEVTHGLIHRIRPLLLDRTNRDVAAFHEAVADITAIFLHFTLPGVVESTIAATRTRLTNPTPLAELAQQFGYATGRNAALRGAIDVPDPRRYETELEPHTRGSLLVAAVFEAFMTSYQRRIADLLRLASGGTGLLPRGAIPPDLVKRVSQEAGRAADQVLSVCLRAFDYLPPLDVTFSDFLRALVTADRELFPTDAGGLRTSFIDAFRRRGIYPTDVYSLADDALIWPSTGSPIVLPDQVRADILAMDALSLDRRTFHRDDLPEDGSDDSTMPSAETSAEMSSEPGRAGLATRLAAWLQTYAPDLDLSPSLPIRIRGIQSMFRYDEDGAPHIDFVIQCTQHVDPADVPSVDPAIVEPVLRRGTTVIFNESGKIRYIVSKPLPARDLAAEPARRAMDRVEALDDWLEEAAHRDGGSAFGVGPTTSNPLRMDFARLHRGMG